MRQESPLIRESDKHFWHGYIAFYENHFASRDIASILEFGVLKGNSIRWLMERFPAATVDGVDILSEQEEWPRDARVSYHRLDQGRRNDIRDFFQGRSFDLVIEDGSHVPEHQVACLIEGLPHVNSNGLYIVEDIQTSLPKPKTLKSRWKELRKGVRPNGNALSTLLSIEHFRRIGRPIDSALAKNIAHNNMITQEEILELDRNIKSLWLYRRNHLPDKCYNCGSSEFNYGAFKCLCGREIFSHADSMTFVIEKK